MRFQRSEASADLGRAELDRYPGPDAPRREPTTCDALVGVVASIEELPGAGPLKPAGHTDRWLGLTIAAAAAVVCLGFVSHVTAPAPAHAPAPTAETVAIGASSATLTPSPPAPASPVSTRTRYPLSAPGDAVGGQLEHLTVWHERLMKRADGQPQLEIDGFGPSTMDPVTVRVRTTSGTQVASVTVSIGVDDERPGAGGEPRAGLGRFERLIALPGPTPAGGWQVEIAWSDPVSGASGTGRHVVLATW